MSQHPTPVEIEAVLAKHASGATRAHVESCGECIAVMRTIEALGDPLTWNALDLPDAPQLDTMPGTSGRIPERIREAEGLRHADPAAAVGLCDGLLRTPECQAESEEGRHFTVLVLRERANALRVLGDLRAALDTVTRARPLADELLVSDYENAVLDYVEATILYEQEELALAEKLARRAETTLRLFGDAERAGKARLLEAAVAFERGDLDRARPYFIELLQSDAATPSVVPGLLHNLAHCEVRMGLFDDARVHIDEASIRYQALGMRTEVVRLGWLDARMSLAKGEVEAAERLYVAAQSGFHAAGLDLDAALVGLELAELYEREGRRDEVVAHASRLASVFARTGSRISLARALAALRDAALRGEDLAAPVATARATIEMELAAGS